MPTTTGIVESIAVPAWEQTFAGPPQWSATVVKQIESKDSVFCTIRGFICTVQLWEHDSYTSKKQKTFHDFKQFLNRQLSGTGGNQGQECCR
jgi:hypothetical protein